MPDSLKPWWGETSFKRGEQRRWQIGPLTLWIERAAGEWRLATKTDFDWRRDEVEVALEDDFLLERRADFTRIAADDDDCQIEVRPRLADRDIVTRPETAFHVLAGDDALIYVGTPLWLEVRLCSSGHRVLRSQPLFPTSRTWFGPDTTEGEMCYASRTFCRLQKSKVSFLPHRAISIVHVKNRGSSTLQLARMVLPVTHLSLFYDDQARLWSDELTLTRTAEDEFSRLEREQSDLRAPSGMRRLSEPRVRETSFLLRAFSPLRGSSSFQKRARGSA